MATMVHETQQHYRELVDLFSRPGEVRANRFDTPNFTSFSDATLATVLTLFDNEIHFTALDRKDSEEFMTLTGGRSTDDYGMSDFVVVHENALDEEIFEAVRGGTLASPEKSATLIIELASIGEGRKYRLQGPGIKTFNEIEMTLDPKWMELRNARCREFPIGIDLILIDRASQMAVIPRTTSVEVV